MLSRTPSLLVVCVSVAIAFCMTGCFGGGPELGTVTGTVTLDGKPLAEAQVTFQPKDGSYSVGTTDSAGRYELEYTRDKPGAIVGSHIVRIKTQTTSTDESGNEIQVPQRVPEKYNYRSMLLRQVEPGENRFDFKLESEPETEEPGAEEPEGEGADKAAAEAGAANEKAPETGAPGVEEPAREESTTEEPKTPGDE
ncbi:MAG: hypothetical protein HQ582_21375 [Planctomycetes bacterium]|nr:hypothetical protein [Planctomycetota bacterium]